MPKLRNRVQDGKKGVASLCGARQVALCATHGPVCGRLRSDGSIRLPDVLLHPPRVLRRGSRSLDYVECRTGCTLFQHPGWPDSVASCTYVPRKVRCAGPGGYPCHDVGPPVERPEQVPRGLHCSSLALSVRHVGQTHLLITLGFRRAFDVRQHPPVDAVKDRVREQSPVAGGPHIVSIPRGSGARVPPPGRRSSRNSP